MIIEDYENSEGGRSDQNNQNALFKVNRGRTLLRNSSALTKSLIISVALQGLRSFRQDLVYFSCRAALV